MIDQVNFSLTERVLLYNPHLFEGYVFSPFLTSVQSMQFLTAGTDTGERGLLVDEHFCEGHH